MADRPKPTESEQLWLEHLRACERSGLSSKAYALEHGLKLGALYEARKRLRRKGALRSSSPVPRFARVHSEPAAGEPPAPTLCRVHLRNGTVVELACPPGQWRSVLEAAAALR